jgi:hypothetical protein
MPITEGRYLRRSPNLHRLLLQEPQLLLVSEEIDTYPSRESAALKSNRRSILNLDSSDAQPLSNSSPLGVFSRLDFKLKSLLERGLLTQSSLNQTEQPPTKAGAGWLFIAAEFHKGNDQNGHGF